MRNKKSKQATVPSRGLAHQCRPQREPWPQNGRWAGRHLQPLPIRARKASFRCWPNGEICREEKALVCLPWKTRYRHVAARDPLASTSGVSALLRLLIACLRHNVLAVTVDLFASSSCSTAFRRVRSKRWLSEGLQKKNRFFIQL